MIMLQEISRRFFAPEMTHIVAVPNTTRQGTNLDGWPYEYWWRTDVYDVKYDFYALDQTGGHSDTVHESVSAYDTRRYRP